MKITRRRMFTALAAVATAGLGGLGIRSGAARYYDGPVSDHFDGLRFFDPHGSPPNSVAKLFRWYTGRSKAEWPAWAPSPYTDRPPARIAGTEWRISFVGHATVLLQTAGVNVLTDPFWSERASPFTFIGPKRVNDPGCKRRQRRSAHIRSYLCASK